MQKTINPAHTSRRERLATIRARAEQVRKLRRVLIEIDEAEAGDLPTTDYPVAVAGNNRIAY